MSTLRTALAFLSILVVVQTFGLGLATVIQADPAVADALLTIVGLFLVAWVCMRALCTHLGLDQDEDDNLTGELKC